MPHLEMENISRAVGVIGGSTMEQGVVQSFAQAELSVSVVDVDKGQLNGYLVQVDANLKLFQEFGLLQEDIPSIKSRILRDIGAHRTDGLFGRHRYRIRSSDWALQME